MALPNGLPQVSDLGQLLSTLGSNIVSLPKMQATSAPGTPAAGYFHSTVINRAEMPDLRKDLSVNLGINRISLQQLVQVNDEAGSNSMPVYKAANDPLDRVRVVGTSDVQNNTAGQFFRVGILGDLNTGYIEITYYGTGLNILITQPGATHTFSTGVLTKYNTRELVYVGSGWGIGTVDTATNWISGFRTQTTGVSTTDYMEYTFYGTGIELDLFVGGSGSATMNVQVDGVNWSGTTNVRGAGYSWSSPTLTATAVSVGCKLQLTGMTLSKHTVRITRTSASTDMSFGGVHIITPVHSYKEKESFTLQNTSPIGSQGINDSRKFISRDGLVRYKSVSQAIGIAASPTSNITSFIPVPDLSATHNNTTGKIKVSYSLDVFGTASSVGLFRIFVDGISVSDSRTYTGPTGGSGDTRLISDSIVIPVSPGMHKVDVMWFANTGTITAGFTRRTLLVEEVD